MGRRSKVKFINSGNYMTELSGLNNDVFSNVKVNFSNDELERIKTIKKEKMEKKLKKCPVIL